MFGLGGPADKVASLAELNIAPLSISYEWEPCDILKTLELYASDSGKPYIKKPGEDFHSILTGITQPKGRVHLTVCEPIHEEELEAFRSLPSAAFNREVAALIDRRILPAYKAWPNNYIAADILREEHRYSYTEAEKQTFVEHVDSLTKEYPPELRNILLNIYAAPVIRR